MLSSSSSAHCDASLSSSRAFVSNLPAIFHRHAALPHKPPLSPRRRRRAAVFALDENPDHPPTSNLPQTPQPAVTPATTVKQKVDLKSNSTLPPPPSPPPPQLSSVEVFLERLSDTVVDARIHYSRLFRQQKPATPGPRIVVLGSGWAAHSVVKVVDPDVISDVTVISPRNFFFFTPLLSATAVGTIEFRSIVEPIRAANPYITYYEAFATDVDTDAQCVHCLPALDNNQHAPPTDITNAENSFSIPYDILVVAVGETTTTFGVSGARRYAYFLKEISDARRLRKRILDALETASLPTWTDEERRDLLHFVVVGGGPTGCEFAGELSDFVSNDLAPRYGKQLVSLIRVSLLQSGKSLLTQFEQSLQDVALQNFEKRVEVVFGARVVEVTEEDVVLQSGTRIRYGVLIWAAGNGTRPIVTKIINRATGEQDDDSVMKRKKIPVDPWLRVLGVNNVIALGDCAMVENAPLPSTAQVAGQQGAFVGRLVSKVDMKSFNNPGAPILRDSSNIPVNPFRFLSLGIMAYLGNDRAIVQLDATRDRKITLGGRIGYVLWRSVYAVKQVDVRNRVLVLFDYAKTRFFGRDISQF